MAHLARDLENRWLAGVFAGIAKATQIPVWVLRLVFVIFTLLLGLTIVGGLIMVATYIIAAIFIPPDVPPTPVEGEPQP
jgi:phage shock protein PspC (stress-responsive transcriptional regulator)